MKVSGQLHATASLLQKKKPVPIYRKLVGTQSQSRRSGEKEILAPTRIRTLGRPARSLVPIQTTLPRLQMLLFMIPY
jgi:hypothetical protein